MRRHFAIVTHLSLRHFPSRISQPPLQHVHHLPRFRARQQFVLALHIVFTKKVLENEFGEPVRVTLHGVQTFHGLVRKPSIANALVDAVVAQFTGALVPLAHQTQIGQHALAGISRNDDIGRVHVLVHQSHAVQNLQAPRRRQHHFGNVGQLVRHGHVGNVHIVQTLKLGERHEYSDNGRVAGAVAPPRRHPQGLLAAAGLDDGPIGQNALGWWQSAPPVGILQQHARVFAH